MKSYYIKQKVISLSPQYQIFDEEANPIYFCAGAFLSLGNHLDFYRIKEDKLLFQLKRTLFSIFAKFTITDSKGESLASVGRVIGMRYHQINVASKYGKFTIYGDFLTHDFTIADRLNHVIVTVHKKWFSIGDSYEITIDDGANVPFMLALSVLIDNCYHNGLGIGSMYTLF